MLSTQSGRIFALQALVVVLFLLRWPLIPDVLPNFDAANFAYALNDFNPSEHKPQPPGYPFFVALTRLIHTYIADVPTTLVTAGLLGSFVALVATGALANILAGPRAAIIATVLLLVHPALWSDGILNPVRAFIAAGSAVIGLACWKAWAPDSSPRWLIAAFAAAGVVSGFRPGLVVLLMPLLLAVALRRGFDWRTWTASAAALLLTSGIGVAASASASGGLAPFLLLLRTYLHEQSETSSLFYGASLLPALKMAGRAVLWAFAPTVAWLWLLPFLRDRRFADASFFTLWILPPFLFLTLIHSAEPGHILPLVVPACVLGGLALNSASRPVLCATGAAVASIALFLWPPIPVMRPSSVEAIWVEERRVSGALEIVRKGMEGGPVTIVTSPAAAVPWRVLTYYFPQYSLVALNSDPGSGRAPSYWQVRGGSLEKQGSADVALNECGGVVWFLSATSTAIAERTVSAERLGPGLLSGPPQGSVGEYNFHSPANCGPVSTLH